MEKAESDLIDQIIRPLQRNRETANSMVRTFKERAYIAKWIDYRKEVESNDAAAEEAICQLYRWANKYLPDEILWFDSPDKAMLQVSALRMARRWQPQDFVSLIETALLCRLASYTGHPAEEVRACCEPRWWRMRTRLQEVDQMGDSLFRTIIPDLTRGFVKQGLPRLWVSWDNEQMLLQNWVGLFAGADCAADPDNVAARTDIEYGAKLARYVSLLWLTERVAVACRKPKEFYVDENYRPHNSSGPAIVFKGEKVDWRCWCWHGTPVPHQIIEHSESITIQEIQREINLEYRRILLERFGIARYLEETNAREFAKDEFGTLFRMPGREPFVILQVINSTPEPDGKLKKYFLHVPPNVVSPKEAVAWTFGMRTEDYAPSVES